MTYRELDEAANRLAHLLADQGAGPGQYVALAASALVGRDSGDFGGAQDRGGVSADRSGAAGGPDRVHDRRHHGDRRDHDGGPAAAAGRVWPAGPARHRRGRPSHRRPAQHRIARTRTRRHRACHLHLGHHRGAQGCHGDPPQCRPVVRHARGRRGADTGTGVVAVPLAGVRLLGVGDLGCPATRRAAGHRARGGGPFAARVPRPAGRREGHGVDPDPVGGGGVVTAGTGVHDAGDRRRGLPDRGGGSVGAGSGDGQCLRAHRDDDVDVEECPVGGGVRGAADRVAGDAGRGVCVGRLAASGARRGGR